MKEKTVAEIKDSIRAAAHYPQELTRRQNIREAIAKLEWELEQKQGIAK